MFTNLADSCLVMWIS